MARKKLESTFINMLIVLCSVTFISAAALGFVYNKTKDRIAWAKNSKKLGAIKEVVLSDYNNFPNEDMFEIPIPEGGKLECYPAKKGTNLTSIAIKTFTKKGFSGDIWLMVGFLPDGTIHKIKIIDQKETPGLGTKIDGDWNKQFEGKNPSTFKLKVKQDGGDVDAITAATISSRAVCDAVERAYLAFNKHQNK